MSAIDVKWFDYDILLAAGGAVPTLSGTVGSMIGLLDACLVDGFNVKSVQSLTVAGNVGTVVFPSAGHGYVLHQVIRISGANEAALNGEWRVTEVQSTSLKLAMPGVANQTATGTLSARAAPCNWIKQFSGTNRAAYKNTGLLATGTLLRVDDTLAQYSRVRGYETMTGINTGVNMFPSATQRTESNWGKSDSDDSEGRKWTLVGDSRFFYLIVHTVGFLQSSAPNARLGMAFGDIVSYKSGDQHGAVLFSSLHPTPSIAGQQSESAANILHRGSDVGIDARAFLCRPYAQAGTSESAWLLGFAGDRSGISPIAYPNPTDSGIYLVKSVMVAEGTALRGELPGYYACLQHRPLTHGALLENVVAGRVLMLIGTAYSTDSGDDARWAVDITGPWR